MTPTETLYHEKRKEYFRLLRCLKSDIDQNIMAYEAHGSCPYIRVVELVMDDVRRTAFEMKALNDARLLEKDAK